MAAYLRAARRQWLHPEQFSAQDFIVSSAEPVNTNKVPSFSTASIFIGVAFGLVISVFPGQVRERERERMCDCEIYMCMYVRVWHWLRVSQVVLDRQRGAKSQLRISGVTRQVYWTAQLLHDLTYFLPTVVVTIMLSFAFQV